VPGEESEEKKLKEKTMNKKELSASQAGQVLLGKEISVNRLSFGAMRLTGEGEQFANLP
jgi:hypothetical protein